MTKHKTRLLIGIAGLSVITATAIALTANSLSFTKASNRCSVVDRGDSISVGSNPPPSTDFHRGSGKLWEGADA